MAALVPAGAGPAGGDGVGQHHPARRGRAPRRPSGRAQPGDADERPVGLTPEQLEAREWAREFARRAVAPRALELDTDPESPVRDVLLDEAAAAGMLGHVAARDARWQRAWTRSASAGHRGDRRRLQRVRGALRCHHPRAAARPVVVRLLGHRTLRACPSPVVEHRHPKLAALAATEPEMGSDFIIGHPDGPHGHTGPQGRRWLPHHGHQGVHLQRVAGQRRHGLRPPRPRRPRDPVRDNMVCLAVPTDTPGFSVG